MKKKYLVILTLLTGLLSSVNAISGDFVNVKPFFGNFTGGGLEYAIPLLKEIDVEDDGYAETIQIRYKRYNSATGTYLSGTIPKKLATPELPEGCSGADSDDEWGVDFRRSGGALDSGGFLNSASNRIHTAISFELGCYDGFVWQERYGVVIYSADMSGTTSMWSKQFPGWELAGFDEIDTDGDLVNDKLAIALARERPDGTEDMKVYVVNSETGAEALTPRSFPLFR
jgi:hypothetical protein